MPSEDKIFPDKYKKKIDPTFTDAVDGMDTEEIKKKILESEGNIYEIENSKDNDEKLVQAREMVKEIAAPYRESKAMETAKIKYCLFVLESRGVNL